MTYALWTLQGLLALLFLGLGIMKLTSPIEEISAMMGLPGLLIQFIGTVEVLGALGLILPGLLRNRLGLAPLAAAGLALVALSAVVYHLTNGDGMSMASFPLIVALLSGFVAYGRWRWAPYARPAAQRVPARI
jgi:DoxX-like protein